MSSFDRRTFLLAPLVLTACGFTPAFAPEGAANDLTRSIFVEDPNEKRGFDLVQRLEERLGRPQNAKYRLAYVIRTDSQGVGITPDNVTTRFNLTGSVDWTLSDTATGARLTGGRVQNFTSYAATGATVAGLAAQEDAMLRLMRILADQIVARLIATAGQWG
jgi:LPS-assembly lipoprotein